MCLAGIIGTIQATEALKLVLGIGRSLTDRLLDFDARKTQFREIKVKRNPDCALCGAHPDDYRIVRRRRSVCRLCRSAVIIRRSVVESPWPK